MACLFVLVVVSDGARSVAASVGVTDGESVGLTDGPGNTVGSLTCGAGFEQPARQLTGQ